MRPFSPPARTPAKLSDSINRSLNLYTLAATAAGVGMVALAQPAHAKIVYTPAHLKLGPFAEITLDLNHDGKGDFVFSGSAGHKGSQTLNQFLGVLRYSPGMGNGIIGTTGRIPQASALHAGARIGTGKVFNSFGSMAQESIYFGKHSSSSHWKGQWANGGKGVENRYLGLKFNVNGKMHFGWARLTVKTTKGGFTTTLTGYAYETIPNKSIIAGKTKGADDKVGAEQVSSSSLAVPTPAPRTLGMLALGTQGIPLWRRKESAGAIQ